MTLSKLQSEAVILFDEKWVKAPDFHDPNTHQNYPTKYTERMSSLGHFVNMEEIKQFISDQIEKAVEKTRKETLKEVKIGLSHIKYPNIISKPDDGDRYYEAHEVFNLLKSLK